MSSRNEFNEGEQLSKQCVSRSLDTTSTSHFNGFERITTTVKEINSHNCVYVLLHRGLILILRGVIINSVDVGGTIVFRCEPAVGPGNGGCWSEKVFNDAIYERKQWSVDLDISPVCNWAL